MNAQQLVNMVTRMVLSRVVRHGVDAGMRRAVGPPGAGRRSERGQSPSDFFGDEADSRASDAAGEQDAPGVRSPQEAEEVRRREERRAVREARRARKAARGDG